MNVNERELEKQEISAGFLKDRESLCNEHCAESRNTTNVVVVLGLLSRDEMDLKDCRLGGLCVHTEIPNGQVSCSMNFSHSTASIAWLDKHPLRGRYLRQQSRHREKLSFMSCFDYYVLPNGTFSDTDREEMALNIKQEGNDKIPSC